MQHTPALMVQGTSSDAGKSLLTAALCRIFTQDGLKVVPFKAQNMALNSCVTPEGLEMGRAQAVQAAACRLAPDARMNPVLLKPTSDMGSQVIVMGKPVGQMRVREYWAYKPTAFEAVQKAYDELAAEADLVVLEGAGSPAEINLREHDIVNMRMARHAGARVLLAGDIDRGGVFASLVGTMMLLEEWEKELVAGFVINKFRGDASLLPPAFDFVKEKTGKAVLGLVPWIAGLNLPDEDSVSFKAGRAQSGVKHKAAELDVALIDLPRISNVTDIDALEVEPDVRLRIVRRVDDLGQPDMIVLPGSKNTLADLAYLRASGLAGRIRVLAAHDDGPVIVGICGGLQMLGERIEDPLELEQGGSAPGLGLLPLTTTLAQEKTLRKVCATTLPDRATVDGYEIHHGRTEVTDADADTWIVDDAGEALGWRDARKRVYGAYTHGLFDADTFRRGLLDDLRQRKGLPRREALTPYSLEPGLERLAQVVRAGLDMDAIYRLIHRSGGGASSLLP